MQQLKSAAETEDIYMIKTLKCTRSQCGVFAAGLSSQKWLVVSINILPLAVTASIWPTMPGMDTASP